MSSVTARVHSAHQPQHGYIPASSFKEQQFVIGNRVTILPFPRQKIIQGTVVDYLTRFLIGFPKEKAFEVSLLGARNMSETNRAKQLLDSINGIDEASIISACKLVAYDDAFRVSILKYVPLNDYYITPEMISNISEMVKRCVSFFTQFGPVVKSGFTFEGGYNRIIDSGDGDYLTEDTLWDFKVSEKPLDKFQTLQLAVYYIMGVHSIHPEFQRIKRIGIYNPFLNVAYTKELSEIDNSVFSCICRDVIGYVTIGDSSIWKKSFGTRLELFHSTNREIDTGFDPMSYPDGIHKISADDYWSFYKKHSLTEKPQFYNVSSIKFIKNQGFFLFAAISPKGSVCSLHGGQKKKLTKPLQYYFENLPKYCETVIRQYSIFGKALRKISEQIRAIEPDTDWIQKYPYNEYIQKCRLNKKKPLKFEKWYAQNKNQIKFKGTIHGSIVDFDYFNHVFLNPNDGTIVPYNADNKVDKFIYQNVASLINDKRPEMLKGYTALQENQNTANEDLTKPTVTNDVLERISKYGLISIESENIGTEQTHIPDTDMYSLSNRLLVIQMIEKYHYVAEWYDHILPDDFIPLLQQKSTPAPKVKIIKEAKKKEIKKQSYIGKTATMNCGLSATIIEDFGCKDITIEFEDGLIRKHCRRDRFKEGKIAHKSDENEE